jgi:ribosomal protein S27E
MIPYGTRHTVSLSAQIWKPVKCEHCGTEFVYRMAVRKSGQATNVLWLNRGGAIADAQAEAAYRMRKAAREDFSIAACPGCGKYQAVMGSALKRHNTTNQIVLGLLAAGATALAVAFPWLILLGLLVHRPVSPLLWIFPPMLLSVLVFLYFVRRARLYDPNSGAFARIGMPFSDTYAVLRKAEFDVLQARQVTPPESGPR